MPVVVVVAAVIEAGGRVLVTKRPEGTHLAGLWEFPGGKVEEGEAPEAALVRELREELGIDVRVGGLVETIEHAYSERTVRLMFYRCAIVEGEPQDLGVAAHRWVALAQLRDEEFPPADARLLARLRAPSGIKIS